MGADLHFGSVACFTGRGAAGSGAVVFTGDNDAPDTSFGSRGEPAGTP